MVPSAARRRPVVSASCRRSPRTGRDCGRTCRSRAGGARCARRSAPGPAAALRGSSADPATGRAPSAGSLADLRRPTAMVHRPESGAARVAADVRPDRIAGRFRPCASASAGRAALQPRHSGRRHAGGAAGLSRGVPLRSAGHRAAALEMAADPAPVHSDDAAEDVGRALPQSLDRRGLAPPGHRPAPARRHRATVAGALRPSRVGGARHALRQSVDRQSARRARCRGLPPRRRPAALSPVRRCHRRLDLRRGVFLLDANPLGAGPAHDRDATTTSRDTSRRSPRACENAGRAKANRKCS